MKSIAALARTIAALGGAEVAAVPVGQIICM
jgi:hypothetical protein